MNLSLRRSNWVFYFVIWGVSACQSGKIPQKSRAGSPVPTHEEDLSSVRPKYKNPFSYVGFAEEEEEEEFDLPKKSSSLDVSSALDKTLQTMIQTNKATTEVTGFRIQVFVGNEKNDYEAARTYIMQLYPQLDLYPSYSQPTYRIKVGDFTARMDAERYVSQLKSRFPNAKVLPDRVDLKKSFQIK